MLDLALDLGGQAQIWRSSADHDPQRIVRGIILDHAPGQETMSLLISPEGWLIGLTEIEDAEKGKLTEPPWISVKTQYGPLEGHVTLIEILAALKKEFIPDLEVSDEAEYWEKRDFKLLEKHFGILREITDKMAAGLRHYGLSPEAAEDPKIVMQRIERIAEKVRRSLGRASEHAPPEFPDDEFGAPSDPERDEALWDELFKHNQRTQARFHRIVEERLARGEDYETALDGAMEESGLGRSDDEEGEEQDEGFGDEFDWTDEDFADDESTELEVEAADADEEPATEPAASDVDEGAEEDDDEDDDFPGRDRHPLQRRASDFWLRLHNFFKEDKKAPETAMHCLMQGVGDLCGGLAQALSEPIEELDDRGLRIVQLKRALRGAAFARGALFNLSSSGDIPKAEFDSMHETLVAIGEDVYRELGRAREASPPHDE